jgi:hypothetical protein
MDANARIGHLHGHYGVAVVPNYRGPGRGRSPKPASRFLERHPFDDGAHTFLDSCLARVEGEVGEGRSEHCGSCRLVVVSEKLGITGHTPGRIDAGAL